MSALDLLMQKINIQHKKIQENNNNLRALISYLNIDKIQKQAQQVYKSPDNLLSGMTISFKDNIYTSFLPTTAGAAFWKDRKPNKNAVVVQRIIDAGAIVVGKANLTELAWGVSGYSAIGGQSLNPLDNSRIAGGSSSGSAASVLAGFCDASVGTDTGGSVRIPASFCGLIGLRPTFGGISNTGVLPLSHSHDTIGIMANNVLDVAKIYTTIAGPCMHDPTSNDRQPSNVLGCINSGVSGLIIGIPSHYYFDYCSSEIANAVINTAKKLESKGAKLVDLKINGAEQAQEMAMCMMSSEVTSLYQHRLINNPESISESIRERMMHAFSYTGLDYANAMRFKQTWQLELRNIYSKYADLIIMPTTTCTAPFISDKKNLLEATKDVARNTYLSAMAGIPSLSIPCKTDGYGLPIGMMLESSWGREDLLFRVAKALEKPTV